MRWYNSINNSPVAAVLRRVALLHRPHVLLFSTKTETASSSSTLRIFNKIRNFVKPFLLKCHPDVHPTETAKKINLTAIQNLNAYMDTLQSIASGKAGSKHGKDTDIVEIDFVMHLPHQQLTGVGGKKKNKKGTPQQTSRRKVELLLPPAPLIRELVLVGSSTSSGSSSSARSSPAAVAAAQRRLENHSKHEIVKLLRVAGLTIPSEARAAESFQDAWGRELGLNDEDYHDDVAAAGGGRGMSNVHQQPSPEATVVGGFRRAHHYVRPKTAYEKNREKFMSSIQWQNFDRMYKEAVRDMKADLATEGLVKHHAGRRRSMIAKILSRIRVYKNAPSNDTDDDDDSSAPPPAISFVEQLVAFRRLSLLLDQHFEELQIEEFGEMWETCRIVLTPAREYNTSAAALRKRRKREGTSTGFSFTLHPNLSVTIHIPVDFDDDELIQELDRNVWDFYDFVGDGMEELFPPPVNSAS